MTLEDLYGTWNVNTEKNVGHDSNRLSGCKNNSHTHGLRSEITDHRKLMGNGEKKSKIQNISVYNLQIPHNAEKNSTAMKG